MSRRQSGHHDGDSEVGTFARGVVRACQHTDVETAADCRHPGVGGRRASRAGISSAVVCPRRAAARRTAGTGRRGAVGTPPPAEPVDQPVVLAPDVAVPAAEPPADLPVAAPDAPLPQEPVGPPPLLPPPPIQQPVPPPLVQAPPERPGILSRIKDKLSGIGRNDEQQLAPAQVPPPVQPPLLPAP